MENDLAFARKTIRASSGARWKIECDELTQIESSDWLQLHFVLKNLEIEITINDLSTAVHQISCGTGSAVDSVHAAWIENDFLFCWRIAFNGKIKHIAHETRYFILKATQNRTVHSGLPIPQCPLQLLWNTIGMGPRAQNPLLEWHWQWKAQDHYHCNGAQQAWVHCRW